MRWWLKLRDDDEPRGPYPTRDIAQRVRRGELTVEMLVRLDEPEMGEWDKIDSVGEIGDELELLEAEKRAFFTGNTPAKKSSVSATTLLMLVFVVGGVLWIATFMLRDYLHLPLVAAFALAVVGMIALGFSAYKWGF